MLHLLLIILTLSSFKAEQLSRPPPHFEVSPRISTTVSSNLTLNYSQLFQSFWVSNGCGSITIVNETISDIWSIIMFQMASAASSFFYFGDFSLEYKIESLFSNSSLYLDTIVPWTLYLLFFLLGLFSLFFLLFCCQVFCIKKYRIFARCCMIDLNSYSGSSKEKYGLFCCIIFSGVLMLMIMALIVLNNDFFDGYLYSKCFSSSLALEIYNPYISDSNWLGTIETVEKLGNASQLYEEMAQSQINQSISINTSNVLNTYSIILQEFETNLSIYENKSLYNPNPLTNKLNPTMTSYILETWGPSTKKASFMYHLKKELESRETFISLLNTAFNISELLLNKSMLFSSIMTERQGDFKLLETDFGEGFNQLIYDLDYFDTYITEFFDFMLGVMFLNVFPMLCGFLGFLMVGFCKWRFFNCCLHCAWIFNCFLLFFLLLLLFYGFFYSGLLVWSCEIYTASLNDSDAFTKVSNEMNMSSSLYNTMNFCLFNTTNNLAYFYPFDGSLSIADELFTSISTLANTTLSNSYLEAELIKLESYYENYELVAGKNTESNSNHPILVLNELNLWSNYDNIGSYQAIEGLCEVTTDEYVFRVNECIYDTIYQRDDEIDEDFGDTLCISFNNTIENFAIERYTDSLFNECSSDNISSFNTVPEAIKDYYIGLFEYKLTTQNLIIEILGSLHSYKEKLKELDYELESLYNQSENSFQAFWPLLEITSDPKTKGLSTGLNCSFLKPGLEKMEDGVCVGSMDGVFYLYISFSLLFLLQMGLALANCCSSIRMLPRDFDSEDEGKVLIEKNASIELRRHSILY